MKFENFNIVPRVIFDFVKLKMKFQLNADEFCYIQHIPSVMDGKYIRFSILTRPNTLKRHGAYGRVDFVFKLRFMLHGH